ncbi:MULTISPECIES: hypothetical protein [Methylobacterium]|uniref:Uncharacterized protein n=4 Tax=Pseudomonadota TaxID=1224 RepID=A0ABQ4SWG9_9HYPH|nr:MULTISPECIES: hypothetical protein [Methylobacterium]PIU05517.1 MAG: hypothetical protein COT56_14070 [Methylobacterium sp. CG09_land_8_20_14_0_10_71_15]PIU13588.1 MAG: hypothetical protein COT28_10850 [Methylobacterium sp. CG08_land_8_20_14_0_20_71_15]GBU17021.1 hypothetical protein AwMethylo_12360 [Methylobacterium sp.]GJD91154.1 hypothetical protein BHAOGJBA_4702 [Methylobacterium hispanicum]GJE06889.1 hypothetical protein AOPFMNJM_2212 [Methylobacterium jeotgali]
MLSSLLSSLGSSLPPALMEARAADKPEPIKLDADGILARFAKAAEEYGYCPFAVGDIVVQRPDAPLKGPGEPCVVLEVLYEPIRIQTATNPEDAGSSAFGRVLDIRYGVHRNGVLQACMGESFNFEAWTPEHETAWREKLAKEAAKPEPAKALTLQEMVAELRDRHAGRERKPEWKKGELVEILSVGDSQHPPMEAEGVKIGLVQEIDPSDGTTKLLYHSGETGKIGGGWFRNDNLRRYGPRPADEIALLGPVVEPTA